MPAWCSALLFLASGAALLMAPARVWAAPAPRTVNIRTPALSQALAELARQTGAEMLYDEALVRNLRASPVRGRLTAQAALSLMLAGTGLGQRMTADGAFVLYRLPLREPGGESDGAISEILVMGRRTQNADIRRTRNDIQPYTVSTAHDIETAHRDNIDGYMRSRVPANADMLSPTQDVRGMPGDTRSKIDLRGLGDQRTLVLVDGRRLPGLPSVGNFDQGDLNGIPLGAIERIETLTSTAGGIYGPNAVGGVVNVILRRDYRGADFTATTGITTRGDAARARLEARIGFTPDGGDTDIMLFGSYAASQRLLAGQRDYQIRAREKAIANSPADYLVPDGAVQLLPMGNAIAVISANGMPLTLDPQLGGTSLNSGITFLPLAFAGTDAERRAALVANANAINFEPPTGYSGASKGLTNNPTVASALFNLRHRFGPDVELFLDGLYFSNDGEFRTADDPSSVITPADAPSNPFAQPIFFRFPNDQQSAAHVNIGLYRLVGGLIVGLPAGWKAEAELAIGAANFRQGVDDASYLNSAFFNALGSGLPGPAGQPALVPLGDWQAFQTALAAYTSRTQVSYDLTNHFTDASVRLSGPVARLPGGALSLTLLGEQRREHVPVTSVAFPLLDMVFNISTPELSQLVRSGYAELRAPLAPRDSTLFFLRGLELQGAARYDSTDTRFPDDLGFGNPSNDRPASAYRSALMFTLGARVFPLRMLMLRGSYATGEVLPTIDQLQSREEHDPAGNFTVADPRRGTNRVGELPYVVLSGGSHDIRQVFGSTLSLGMVINPEGKGGPRLSIDYSRIVTRREIVPFRFDVGTLVANEASYPDRVTRAPLSDADRALGYTGGPVIRLDTRAANSGSTVVQAVDVQFDWRLSRVLGGELAPYLSATWQPSVRTQTEPGQPWIERTGFIDGPLALRGNAGFEWRRGATSIDFNAQYYDSYRIDTAATAATDGANSQAVRFLGRQRIPAQIFVDLAASHRFDIFGAGPLRAIDVRLGIQNLFDRSPEITGQPDGISYSTYGDPRRRRGELAVTTKF